MTHQLKKSVIHLLPLHHNIIGINQIRLNDLNVEVVEATVRIC